MSRVEGQKNWGWLVVLYVFLAGCGGGTFIASYVLALFGSHEHVTRIGFLMGPVLVAIGSLLLIFDLGSPTRCYRLFTTPRTLGTSWMTRGSWILTAFIILGLAYALPSFSLFDWLPWRGASVLGKAFGVAAAVLSLVVPLYPGFLLGVIRSIPLWNTPVLPPFFFLSGLDTGIAILALISLVYRAAIGATGFHLLAAGDIVLIVLLLVVLLAYVEIIRQSGVTAAASVHLLGRPVFSVGVVVCGMLVPLGLLVASTCTSYLATVSVMEGMAVVLILIGGLLLRYSVITSGVRLSVS